MRLKDALKEVQFGTPLFMAVLKIEVRRNSFQVNSFGYGLDGLERHGVAIRVARGFTECSWHYTDKGNLVCGDGKNTKKLPVREFTIVIDDNLEFLNRMCPCESKGVVARKFFAVGVTISSLNPGELDERDTPFYVVLGDVHE